MKKILVIEDEIAYSKLLHNELKKRGYTVIEATNGEKGLEIAIKEKPDIILLDLCLPVMDGVSLLHLLRKDTYGKTAKVIMLTNHEPDEYLIENVVKDKPAYYFIKSDTQLDTLMKKIKELL